MPPLSLQGERKSAIADYILHTKVARMPIKETTFDVLTCNVRQNLALLSVGEALLVLTYFVSMGLTAVLGEETMRAANAPGIEQNLYAYRTVNISMYLHFVYSSCSFRVIT